MNENYNHRNWLFIYFIMNLNHIYIYIGLNYSPRIGAKNKWKATRIQIITAIMLFYAVVEANPMQQYTLFNGRAIRHITMQPHRPFSSLASGFNFHSIHILLVVEQYSNSRYDLWGWPRNLRHRTNSIYISWYIKMDYWIVW